MRTSIAKHARFARAAGLRYISDGQAGIRRLSRRGAFAYVDAHGRPVRSAATLARIRALAIPPAWTDVWIAPHAEGHLQATGRDARGRKQYRYHRRWNEVRGANKYDNVVAFAQALPRIRRRVRRDLRRRGLPREKVLATVVRLLEVSLIRIGNGEYARENHSFGLTTMKNRHVDVHGQTIHFHFRAKSGIERDLEVTSPRLAKIVKRCQDLPGQELFQYVDERGRIRSIGSGDVNEYLRVVTGRDITAKDFRTWAGTFLAAKELQNVAVTDSLSRTKRDLKQAIERVAESLGNTTTVCRNCYIHPGIIDAFLNHSLHESLARHARRARRGRVAGLHLEEAAVLSLLQPQTRRTSGQARRRSA